MRRERVDELHFITPMVNVPSILTGGICSRQRMARRRHASVADPDVQMIRHRKRLPGGRALHAYANLYFSARNPMLYRLREQHSTLCVLAIDPAALDIAGALVSDGNAASRYTRFGPASGGDWPWIDEEWVYAHDWRDPDPAVYARRKVARCAEVLVPDHVPPTLVFGARVCDAPAAQRLGAFAPRLEIRVDARLFFR